MKNWLALFFILLFASTAEAVTWHVNQVSGSSGNSCATATSTTPSSAKATIRQGIQCAKDNGAPGNTVEIAAGNYNERFESGFIPSGSSGNYFTITNKPGDTVTIKPLSTGGEFEALISLEGSATQYVKLLGASGFGFQIDGANQINSSIIIGSSAVNNVIQGVEFLNTEGVNTIFVGGTNNLISSNKIHGGTHAAHPPDVGYPVYVEGNSNTVEYNEIYNFPRYGIHINHSGSSVSNVIVRGNNIHDGVDAAWDDASAIVCSSNCATGNKIYNNVIYNLLLHGYGIVVSGTGTQVFNNTVYATHYYGIYIYPINSNSISVRNNILYNNGSGSILNEAGSGTIMDHNYCNSGCINQGGGTGTINSGSDPFVNKAAGDFHITSASGLTTTGADLSSVGGFTTDYAGNTRTAPWSIGAYEYGAEVIIPPPVSQLVLALPLDAGTGSTAVDVSGLNNNATIVGGATWDNAGKYGKAIAFDGTGYLNVPYTTPSLALSPSMTLEAWVYPTTVPSAQSLPIMFANRYYLFGASNAGWCSTMSFAPFGGFYNTADNYACATSLLTVNQWTHLAVTYDGVTMTFYRDGKVVTTSTPTEPMVSESNNVTIGLGNPGEFFIGKIDEPRIYNYARSPTQIVSDMNTPLIGAPGKLVEIAAPTSVEISAASSLEISAD